MPQIPIIDGDAAEAMRARRRAMLQRFRRAARLMLRPVVSFRKRRAGRRSIGTGKGAFWLDRDEQRALRRVAFLRRILGVKPKETTPRAPVRQTCARQRSPPRHANL